VPLLASDVTTEFGEAPTPAPSNALVSWGVTQESGHGPEMARSGSDAPKRAAEGAGVLAKRLFYWQTETATGRIRE